MFGNSFQDQVSPLVEWVFHVEMVIPEHLHSNVPREEANGLIHETSFNLPPCPLAIVRMNDDRVVDQRHVFPIFCGI